MNEEFVNKDVFEEIEQLLRERRFAALRARLDEFHASDLADILESLSDEDLPVVYRILPKDTAIDVFSYMNADAQEHLVRSLTDRELKSVLDEQFVDDVVDLIQEMPAFVVARVLKNADEATRRQINQLLNYPEDSAGSIMTTEYVSLKRNMSVAQALARIRKIGVDRETIYTCYVTEQRRLIGIITVKDLLLAPDEQPIADIMETHIISVNTHDDKEDVAKMFDRYDFLALPVVDSEDCLVGIVTVDDAIDVLQEEATEDISKMAAVSPSETDYLHTSVFVHARNRIPWLLILMFTATITGLIINHYENAFAAVPLLVSFIPMLMDTSGNSGSQSSALIIRGLALDEIHFRDLPRVIFKEFRIALVVGSLLAVANGVRVWISYGDVTLALVICVTLICTVMIAKFIGCTLPILAQKCGLDPALMAAPLITTIVDTCTILIFFTFATLFFHLGGV